MNETRKEKPPAVVQYSWERSIELILTENFKSRQPEQRTRTKELKGCACATCATNMAIQLLTTSNYLFYTSAYKLKLCDKNVLTQPWQQLFTSCGVNQMESLIA